MTRLPYLLAGALLCVPIGAEAQTPFEEVLDEVGQLHLEETDDAFVQIPNLVWDGQDGWLYWDRNENQVRLYEADGSLAATFGRRGRGPGEFLELSGATRLDDGTIVALDTGNERLTLFSPEGELLDERAVSGTPTHVIALNGDHVLLAGNRLVDFGDNPESVLQKVQLSSDQRTSVLDLNLNANQMLVTNTVTAGNLTVHGGRVWVTLPPLDSLWGVSLASPEDRVSLPIPSPALASVGGVPAQVQDRNELRSWMREAFYVDKLFPTPSGGWVGQVWRPGKDQGSRRLVRFDDDGNLLWEVADRRMLVAQQPETGELLLWDPDGVEPNRIDLVREKTSGQ